MSAFSSIEWTDRTWNPVTGCTKVSQGCKHCYAEGVAGRFFATQYRPVMTSLPTKTIDTVSTSHHEDMLAIGTARPRRFTDVQTHEERLLEPHRWRRASKVFVNSMSDLFHEAVPDAFIDEVFAVMTAARRHTFQVLTKRPERMRAYMATPDRAKAIDDAAVRMMDADRWSGETYACLVQAPSLKPGDWPCSNVWLGVSIEDQATADARIPVLLETPAAIRFVSYEPALGPVDFEAVPLPAPGAAVYGLRGVLQPLAEKDTEADDWKYWTRRKCRLDWVIVGGESGRGARPCAIEWAESTVRQCKTAGVPVFVKQLGAFVVSEERSELDVAGHREWQWRAGLKNRKGGDPAEWPEDLRVREFPR